MKRPLLPTLAFCVVASGAFAEQTNRVETGHVHVEWVDGTRPDLIDMAKSEAEGFYDAIARMLGEEPDRKIIVMLRGPSEQPGGERKAPRVDPLGRIELYSFDPSGYSYFSALAHEMVHAFRFDRRGGADWFFEEGLAEMLALRVDSSLAGFPWFDYPVDLVAGQWIVSGDDVPLAVMRDRHRDLNTACRAQTYSLRSSFFDYLGRAYGDSKVVAMANREKAGAREDYAKFFGKTFDALAAEWRESLLTSYRGIDNADEQALRFRTDSPIRYIPVCKSGKDF
jgi:hypothetical protein